MYRYIHIILFMMWAFISSGCIAQLLNLSRSPGAVANAVAQGGASSLVGNDVTGLFSTTETAQSIDNALANNSGALNANELRSLRSELDKNGMGINNSNTTVDAPNVNTSFDRRAGSKQYNSWAADPKNGIIYETGSNGFRNTPRVPIEEPLPPDRLMRSRGQWRFSSPRQSNLHQQKLKFKSSRPMQGRIIERPATLK